MKSLLFLLLFPMVCYSQETECSQVTREVDKFTDDVTIKTPNNDIIFVKLINGTAEEYYLIFYCNSTDYEVEAKGLIILLSDSTKIKKPDAVIKYFMPEDLTKDYVCSTYFRLTEEELKRVSESTITDYRMNTIDTEYGAPERLQAMINCIIPMK